MLAVAEGATIPTTVEAGVSTESPIITTLYDLMAILQDEVEPWSDNDVTTAVVQLCKTGHLHFLNRADEREAI